MQNSKIGQWGFNPTDIFLTKKVVSTVRGNKSKKSALKIDLLKPLFLYEIKIKKVERVEAEQLTKSIETKQPLTAKSS